ncbi:MAG: serine--tRNA ligase [Candidatus Bostrichicola ureolyticus]|nr:MAG: serine--tRNA ligase [Candidatus Bostrichicola ureolyticus]
MLQVSFIRNNKQKVLSGLYKRNFIKKNLINEILCLDKQKIETQIQLNNLLKQSNSFSKEIGKLLNKKKDINLLYNKSVVIKHKIKQIKNKLNDITNLLIDKLIQIPNIPSESVKKGHESSDNEIIYQEIDFKYEDIMLPHWELSKKFELLDFELSNKITNTGFPVYMGLCAKLQRSLIQFFLDKNIQAGYFEYCLPYIVNNISVYSTGQLPDKENQMYQIKGDNLYLIPTGEVPLLNCYRNKLLLYNELPIKATTHTSCFRREAGSYGSNVKGLNRVHQFEKVEIIQITTYENSYAALDEMVLHIKNILKMLKLPFRILRLCGGKMGFTAEITYDFEVYAAGQKKWLEVSSVSNCSTFQSSRLKLRYRTKDNNIKLCHTLNGSALALPRILAALLENNQMIKYIKIPDVLIPYTGFNQIKILN